MKEDLNYLESLVATHNELCDVNLTVAPSSDDSNYYCLYSPSGECLLVVGSSEEVVAFYDGIAAASKFGISLVF